MSQIIKEKQNENERVSKESSKIIEFVNNYDKMKVIPLKASPFAYWRSLQETITPISDPIARVAAFYLTPPPSSADVERLFSTAGHIYSDDRK